MMSHDSKVNSLPQDIGEGGKIKIETIGVMNPVMNPIFLLLYTSSGINKGQK